METSWELHGPRDLFSRRQAWVKTSERHGLGGGCFLGRRGGGTLCPELFSSPGLRPEGPLPHPRGALEEQKRLKVHSHGQQDCAPSDTCRIEPFLVSSPLLMVCRQPLAFLGLSTRCSGFCPVTLRPPPLPVCPSHVLLLLLRGRPPYRIKGLPSSRIAALRSTIYIHNDAVFYHGSHSQVQEVRILTYF